MRRSPLLSLLPLALLAAPAQADLLNAGDTLCIEFTIDNNFNLQPDLMVLNFGIIQVNQAYTSRSAALFDGGTLLGVDTKGSFGSHVGALSLNPSNGFVAAGSLWTFKNPAIVDYTTILDGTIQGRIEFTIQTGQVDIPLNQVNLRLGKSIGSSSWQNVTPNPSLTSVSIIAGGGCPGGGVGSAYCFGDQGNCPCANHGAAGEGCANSTGSGAALSATGSTVAANDDVVFAGAALISGAPALLFVGDEVLGGGMGFTFGDGLRCAAINVIRLGVEIPDSQGAATWGPGLGGGNWTAGDTRRFQIWYRDPFASPCGTGFNLSNGLEITFD